MSPRKRSALPRALLRHLPFALLALTACTPEPPPWFRSCAAERGLRFQHERGPTRYWFPEIMGGGVGLLDLDGNGTLDVYLVQSGDLATPSERNTDRLFTNDGHAHFTERTAELGSGERGYGMGCAIGDADEDGDPDVYVTNVGPNALLQNDGGRLREAAQAGVADPGWGTSACWADFDADGDLDLYVANYVCWSREREMECRSNQGERDYCSPMNYDAPARDVLYRNEGGLHFSDVSERAGLGAAFGNGLGVVAADLDDDGWIDFFVANDQMPNQLWHNEGDGTFTDRALLAGCAVNKGGTAEAGMGVVAADLEDDGDLDLFVTHLRNETNVGFVNQKRFFQDETASLGLGAPSLPFTGFGAGIHDFDLDGRLDVFVANGAVTRNLVPFDPADPYAEPNQLYRGTRASDGRVRFEEVLPRGGSAEAQLGNSRGAAFGDLDEDGDVDVIVVNNGGAVELLLNQAARHHWIGLDLRERSGRAAEGARVRLECGDLVLERLVTSGGSYCASSDPRLRCGLGERAEPVRVTVRWVDRATETFGPLEADKGHRLRRGEGTGH
jgi:hypothetical protein